MAGNKITPENMSPRLRHYRLLSEMDVYSLIHPYTCLVILCGPCLLDISKGKVVDNKAGPEEEGGRMLMIMK